VRGWFDDKAIPKMNSENVASKSTLEYARGSIMLNALRYHLKKYGLDIARRHPRLLGRLMAAS